MYADDLTIYAIGNNEIEKHKIQSELNELCERAYKWQQSIHLINDPFYILATKIKILHTNLKY